ncbi:MAG: ferredoxin--NADP reductase [Myxococcales bacterium]
MTTQMHRLTISAVARQTADCRSFQLCVPPGLQGRFDYRAGQHITFTIPWQGGSIRRCYSLASCPELHEPLEIAVKRVQGGRASNWMNDRLTIGDSIYASVPEGRFVLDPETRPSTPLYLFAGGSGITPIISLLKSALATTKRPITMLYANRDRASVIYGKQLAHLVSSHAGRVVLRQHLDSDDGLLSDSVVRDCVGDTDVAEFYLCGPERFMELVERVLLESGAHEELIHVERFVSPVDPDRQGSGEATLQASKAPASFSLWLGGRSRTVPYERGKTLLECARAAGLNPAHSCESGFCGSCMAHVKTGKVHMHTREALSDRDVARGVALLCQSVPASDEPLELDGDSTSFRAASAVKSSYGKRASQLAAMAVFAFMVAGTLILRFVH